MILKFQKNINQHFPFLKDKKLLIAISGGIDSVVLTHVLHLLKYDISLAHCNFKLRGKESNLDEEFVKNLANEFNIDCHTISFETEIYAKNNKLSIQMAARKLRYNWFEKLLSTHKLDYILTAHHADDVLETFLINLTRSTGLDGLMGIPSINGNIVRPLLSVTREEIESYAQINTIDWREDLSNASTKYVRNKIRHQVIPILKELNPSLMDSFENTLSHLKDSQQIITESIEKIREKITTELDEVIQFNIKEIQKLTTPKIYLFELLKGYNFTEWDDILCLLDAQSGKQIFSKTHRLIKDREFLLLTKTNKNESPITYTIKSFANDFSTSDLTLSFKTEESFSSKKNNNTIIYLDNELVRFPLTLRKWQNGDFFYPFGMTGKKKLSDFFKDEKMSIIDKERIWLLTNSKNEIIWIIGKRLDNRFQITSSTKKIVRITCKNTSTSSV